ncbi:hypothetical protein P692DRAFT_201872759 [Suillus brevipes Sb2]|nr:hypothetical protein P692DRAFT_201872759 [Suillus brevipes Sb2]
MPRTSTSLPFGPVDCSDKVDVTGNHIFMDVENLLVDWPTYTVTFTPTHPGPVTLILRLKNASRFTYIEDSDSDAETSGPGASKESTSETRDDPNLFTAIPVKLAGVRKDFTSKKRKLGHGHFFGDQDSAVWPPRWPRGFRDVSSLPISAFENLKITPAGVVAIDDTT